MIEWETIYKNKDRENELNPLWEEFKLEFQILSNDTINIEAIK